MDATGPRVLVIGLDPHRVPGPWDPAPVVVIGGGIREPVDQLDLFERIVNLVHRHAPDAAIAFNESPDDIFDAAARWLRPAR